MMFKEFLMLDRDKNVSSTKLWQNIGYFTIVVTFIYSVVADQAIDTDMMLIFGSIMIANRSVNKLVYRAFPDKSDKQ